MPDPSYYPKAILGEQLQSLAEEIERDKVSHTSVTSLADWDTLTDTGIFEIVSQDDNVENSPELGAMTLIVIEPTSGFTIQLAMGYHTYRRYYHKVSTNPDTYEWTSWTALVETGSTPLKIVRDNALGTDPNTLYIV
jgi:hypothetical protein